MRPGKMSDRFTTTAEREKFRNGIGYAIIGLGGRQTNENRDRRVFEIDSAAGGGSQPIKFEELHVESRNAIHTAARGIICDES